MATNDIIFLGLKSQVTAISKFDGSIVWVTPLPGGMGDTFVTVACDGEKVYAYTKGSIHCLDMLSGKLLWSNGLQGYGYGTACICVPGHPQSTDAVLHAKMVLDEQRRSSSAAT
jgi:outer membrane protein assembly factor BamB